MSDVDVYAEILKPLCGYLVLGIPFILLEHKYPRRRLPYRSIVLDDLAVSFIVFMIGAIMGHGVRYVLNDRLQLAVFAHQLPRLPLWALAPVALLAADFSLYWIHRAMHTRVLWRTHRWHHSPSELYWLSGIRTSAIHNALFQINTAVWLTLLRAPMIIYLAAAIAGCLANHWMHANVRLRTRGIEWLLVTPRTHAVHHSMAPEHHGNNLGAFLGIWDHLFGTFVDPDTTGEIEFGIPDEVAAPRQMLGI